MIRVFLPSQLDDYTQGEREQHFELLPPAGGSLTLKEVIEALESRFRGLAFRLVDEHGNIRRHIAMFVGETMVRELSAPVNPDSRVQIVGALSGG